MSTRSRLAAAHRVTRPDDNHWRARRSHWAPELEFRKGDSENAALEAIVRAALGTLPMKIIRSYSMQFEADLARIALEGADIPAVVLGVGMGMEGGIGGVQLLVP